VRERASKRLDSIAIIYSLRGGMPGCRHGPGAIKIARIDGDGIGE
jgi:hypothetical protein